MAGLPLSSQQATQGQVKIKIPKANQIRTPILDNIQSTAIWPGIYDGRGLIGKSWQDHLAGMPLEENIRLFKEADEAGDTSRKITWAYVGFPRAETNRHCD
jgi:hypothetical protein